MRLVPLVVLKGSRLQPQQKHPAFQLAHESFVFCLAIKAISQNLAQRDATNIETLGPRLRQLFSSHSTADDGAMWCNVATS